MDSPTLGDFMILVNTSTIALGYAIYSFAIQRDTKTAINILAAFGAFTMLFLVCMYLFISEFI